jgi:hypothetical protein
MVVRGWRNPALHRPVDAVWCAAHCRPSAARLHAQRADARRARVPAVKPLYKPEYWAQVRENDANGNELDPEFKCRLYGVPRLGAPAQIIRSKDQVVLLYAGGFAGQNTFRVVPTDGRPHNPERVKQETWKGDPVGHWEGDTLVIDAVGFTDESWLHKNGIFPRLQAPRHRAADAQRQYAAVAGDRRGTPRC